MAMLDAHEKIMVVSDGDKPAPPLAVDATSMVRSMLAQPKTSPPNKPFCRQAKAAKASRSRSVHTRLFFTSSVLKALCEAKLVELSPKESLSEIGLHILRMRCRSTPTGSEPARALSEEAYSNGVSLRLWETIYNTMCFACLLPFIVLQCTSPGISEHEIRS